jgi:hypothetical protein
MNKDKRNSLTQVLGLAAMIAGLVLKLVLKSKSESDKKDAPKERPVKLNVIAYVKSSVVLSILLAILLGPLSSAEAGWVGFSLLMTCGLLIGLSGPWMQDSSHWRKKPLASVLTFGLLMGVVSILVVNINLNFLGAAVVDRWTWVILGVIAGPAGGLIAAIFDEGGPISSSWWRRLVFLFGGPVMGVFIGGIARLIPADNGMPKGPVTIWLMNGGLMGVFFEGSLILGFFGGRRIKPMMMHYVVLWRCLKEISVLLIPFALGYLATVLIFAGYYWWASSLDFDKGIDAHTFGNALYLSLGTITLYTDATPKAPVTKVIVAIEIIVGLGWLTFVFGTVASALQKCFMEQKEKEQTNPPTS